MANWVDNSGLTDGMVFLRWQHVTGPVPATPAQTEVVDIADVRDYLPADTPIVTTAERAAELQQRMFEFDYVRDQTHGAAWLGANLEYDQIKVAVGADQFTELFGGQQQVPSLLDRLTPTLSPNLATIADHLLIDPAGSLSAIANNRPLALKDVELPAILAVLRLQVLVEQTAPALHDDPSSGDLSHVLVTLGTGLQRLTTVFNGALADPTTSITAGFLNARDDLAVAVMNAGSGFASPNEAAPLWASLAELNQLVAAQLLNPSTLPTDFSGLLDPL